ncbi:MAG: c-type cytochrome [Planctomycetaceae bacterium]|nr:c-type cytochrome [Planctomycetaceae bacterium]
MDADEERRPFQTADKNHDGTVTKAEFEQFLATSKKTQTTILRRFDTSEKIPFVWVDVDRDGSLSPAEFLDFLNAVATPPLRDSDDRTAFGHIDVNNDGYITSEEIMMYKKPETGNQITKTHETRATFSYKGPSQMVTNKSGTKIYVAQHDGNEIAVISTETNTVTQTFPLESGPNGLTLSPDEKILYVTSGGYRGKLAALDSESGKVLNTISTGHTPMTPKVTPDGGKLFLCNRFDGNVAEYELPEMKLIQYIKVVREPCDSLLTPDGKKLLVLNFLPKDPNCVPENPETEILVAAQISVIDTAIGTVKNIRLPKGTCNLCSVCLSSDGRYAYMTHIISHFTNSTDKLDAGQMNVNAVSLFDMDAIDNDKGGYVNTVLLDDPELGAANPWGIAASSDGKKIFVAISGTNELIVLDAEALHRQLESDPDHPSANLNFTTQIKNRVPLKGKGAREVVTIGKTVYVGLYFNDLVVKYDTGAEKESIKVIDTGPGLQMALSQERIGEIAWNDATLCYQQWQSCASCHPDARTTGMNWDLLHDGAGNPKNTKSMVHSYDTPPTMWLGDRFSVRQCTRTGFQYIMFTKPQSEPCECIDIFVQLIQPLQSPYLVNGQLSEKAKRGKKLFEDKEIGCANCHSGPFFTNRKMYDVGTRVLPYEKKGKFDTPTLIEVWRTAPYLHDGRYVNMKDVFKIGKHGNQNGHLEKMTEEQMDDLAEYVLSL